MSFKREKVKSQKSNLVRGWLTEKEMVKLGWDEFLGEVAAGPFVYDSIR